MKISCHCLVKNEERYLWYGVTSVIDYVDEMLIWDTGSSDLTRKIINDLKNKYPSKIKSEFFESVNVNDLSDLRQKMLSQTVMDWILILDGDEVWWNQSIIDLCQTIHQNGNALDTIVVPYYDLVGDTFHFQRKEYEKYQIDDHSGHISVRAINRKISGLKVGGAYGVEGYFDENGVAVQNLISSRRKHLDTPYLHFTHLLRSISREEDYKVIQRSKKNVKEIGVGVSTDFYYPESLFKIHPDYVRSVWYTLDLNKSIVNSGYEAAKRIKLLLWK